MVYSHYFSRSTGTKAAPVLRHGTKHRYKTRVKAQIRFKTLKILTCFFSIEFLSPQKKSGFLSRYGFFFSKRKERKVIIQV